MSIHQSPSFPHFIVNLRKQRPAAARKQYAHADKHSATLSVEGCGRPARAKGLCQRCTMRLRRTGDPMLTRKSGPKPGFRASIRSKHLPSKPRPTPSQPRP